MQLDLCYGPSKDENITIKLVSKKQDIPHSYRKNHEKACSRGIFHHHLDRMVDIFLRGKSIS